MKTLQSIFTAFLLLLAVHSSGQQGINPLEIEITLGTYTLTKAALLDTISKKTNVHFSYNPELLCAGDTIKITSQKTTVLTILNTIVDPEVLGVHSLNNQVILYPVKSTESEEKPVKPIEYITLRGTVSDQKREETIPF